MRSSVKFFIASIVILACALGFFLGSLCQHPKFCGAHPQKKEFHAENVIPQDKHPKEKMDKVPKGPNPELLDSILQVTPEQKVALEKNRHYMDSSFKELRKQKKEAEKSLGEALDNGDATQIREARDKMLAIQKALLDKRIEGVTSLNEIFTKEQLEKFRNFHKENFKKKHKRQNPPQFLEKDFPHQQGNHFKSREDKRHSDFQEGRPHHKQGPSLDKRHGPPPHNDKGPRY